MLTELLRTGEWVEGRSLESDLHEPPAGAVEQAVRDLDGERLTSVLLRNPGSAQMVIAADREGRCLVYVSAGGDDCADCLTPTGVTSGNGATTRIRVFADEVDFPVARTVPTGTAVEVALRFAFDGTLDPDLYWSRTPKGVPLPEVRPRPPDR